MTTQPAGIVPVRGLEDDPEGSRVVEEELRLLATIQIALQTARDKASRAVETRAEDDARLLELRDDIETAKPEDLPALFEQMHTLGAIRSQRGKSSVGVIDQASPYFGHIRLEELYPGDDKPRRRDVLVGARSYVDPGAGVRIVDWRHAPVSRIFYRYREGDDYEEQLGGRDIEGLVVARRSVAIVKGELLRVACPQGTFVRERDTWRRTQVSSSQLVRKPGEKHKLGIGADGQTRRDKLLPAIAAMLDEAQFELITRPGTGVVAIQGSAGSGKTTVGLHRVAYLSAIEPRRFAPEKILVIVPSLALIHYTSRVLPELGVEGVRVTTFPRWAVKVTMDLFPRLPSRLSEDTPSVVTRAKRHARMLGAIDTLVRKVEADVLGRFQAQMGKWEGGRHVLDAWARTQGPADARLTALGQWIAGKREIHGAAAWSKVPEVTRPAVVQLGAELRKLTRDVLGVWDELLTSLPLLTETFSGVAGFGPGQLAQVHAWCTLQSRIRQENDRDGETPSLDAEDPALLLRISQVLRGPLIDIDNQPIHHAHLFVDEIQDSSPVELKVLLDLTGKERSVTLAGDVAQRMLDEGDGGEFDWHELLATLGVDRPGEGALEPLRVSYRSTREITTFARGILGPLAHEAEPIATREGPPVELFTHSSPGEAVAFLADALKDLALTAPDANVAVLARFGPQADVYFDGLVRAEVPNVRRVRRQDFTWEPGVEITDVRQTKGLEWDEAILVDTNHTSYPDSAPARHAAYVGATRAAHQLWCVASDTPSAVFTAALDPTISRTT